MENLIRQTRYSSSAGNRVRFSGLTQDTQEGQNRLPPQKAQPFKGGRQTQNWFRRQFSSQMDQENDSSDSDEFATVIAAAAFAINSLEEEGLQDRKKMNEGLETSLTKSKIRNEDSTVGLPETGRLSRWFSRNDANEYEQSKGEASMKKSDVAEQRMLEGMNGDRKMPENTVGRVPTTKKTLSFADEKLNGTARSDGMKLGPTGDARSTTLSRVGSQKQKGNSTATRDADAEAKAKAEGWEKAEMARIKKRYDKMNTTILSWENEKKTKAQRRLDRIEQGQVAKRRERNLQHYRIEISQIDQIAAEARASAEEKRRKEEFKAKEKVKKIRSTGKVPTTCFCF